MRLVIQRVNWASVTINNSVHARIEKGLLVLVGIENEDEDKDIDWLVQKLIGLRIFSDSEAKMNLSIKDIDGEFLIVSQFTLHASTQKGNRPSFIRAARPEIAIPLYEKFISKINAERGQLCKTGIFGADMKIELCNDGPVTIIIDSKVKE